MPTKAGSATSFLEVAIPILSKTYKHEVSSRWSILVYISLSWNCLCGGGSLGEALSCKNHLPDGGAMGFACFQSPPLVAVSHCRLLMDNIRLFGGWLICCRFFTGILPRKLSCPLKNSGWTTTFLLKWPLFRGHVRFQGCISTGQSDFVRNRSNLQSADRSTSLTYMTRHESINSYIYQLVLGSTCNNQQTLDLKKNNKQADFRTMALRLRYRTPCASSGPSHDSAQRKIAIHA